MHFIIWYTVQNYLDSTYDCAGFFSESSWWFGLRLRHTSRSRFFSWPSLRWSYFCCLFFCVDYHDYHYHSSIVLICYNHHYYHCIQYQYHCSYCCCGCRCCSCSCYQCYVASATLASSLVRFRPLILRFFRFYDFVWSNSQHRALVVLFRGYPVWHTTA